MSIYGPYWPRGVHHSSWVIAFPVDQPTERAWWALLVGNTITYVGAMAYDQIVGAVGPLGLTEYLGLAVVYGSLAVTARSRLRT
jgi:hypothetical protein